MTSTHNRWITAWTADDPLDVRHSLITHDAGTWSTGERYGVEYRDLGLLEASDAKMGAKHLRLTSLADFNNDWRFHELDFQWIYVINGEITIEVEDGGRHRLTKGSAALHPSYWRYRELDPSGDFEALEVTGPGIFPTTYGKHVELPGSPKFEASYQHDSPDVYRPAAGPRPFFEYRDFGLAGPTEGRIHLHLVRSVTKAVEGGTGAHHHSMAQWFMPLSGWADLTVWGEDAGRMQPGDFRCVPRRTVHDVPAYADDYATLEMCIPAKYDTVTIDKGD
ncbi:cupin domain-containing protein [[Mycobacterium] nativiensis]|uniref:Cupin n=1 Tax=[Mycobacterium] nativiensis TaxID=2855503 RepID=A0ABU5XVP3_9MYCO|nr:hypothetical protein [Mycolicibacter sp. MYC340]MEB3031812.1 hypothetical protein [Mycolicibacter sp. MYC340]